MSRVIKLDHDFLRRVLTNYINQCTGVVIYKGGNLFIKNFIDNNTPLGETGNQRLLLTNGFDLQFDACYLAELRKMVGWINGTVVVDGTKTSARFGCAVADEVFVMGYNMGIPGTPTTRTTPNKFNIQAASAEGDLVIEDLTGLNIG